MIVDIHNMPDRVPFMLLPGAVLLPNSVLPLYIFEKKYRNMLGECLDGDRIFGVAMVREGVEVVEGTDDVHDVVGVGLIRACVGNPDGTSSLILHGLGRFRVLEWDTSRSYWVGHVVQLESYTSERENIRKIEEDILDRCNALQIKGAGLPPQLKDYQPGTGDPALLADLLASATAQSPNLRQQLMEELDVRKRLETIRRLLNDW